MSSKSDSTILLPGTRGWELWQGSADKGFRRTLENGPLEASGLEKIPQGRVLMAFPVREALAVPFHVQTTDTGMFQDLAEMHLEKSGVRVQQDAGRLTDVFHVGTLGDQSSLLSVVLSAPRAGSMPVRSPGEFDISARLLPMAEDAVTIWCELGRWVFAVTRGGSLQYFQALPGTELGDDTAREIRLALTQLSLQGVDFHLDKLVIWKSGDDTDPGDALVRQLGEDLDAEVSAEPKPRPVLPDPVSKLVPADVRAEQRLRAERQKRFALIAAVLLVYLGLVGYFGYRYFELKKELKGQQEALAGVDVEYRGIENFVNDWEELQPVVDVKRSPLALLKTAADTIPPGQAGANNLRFQEFEASTELDQLGNRVWKVLVKGEANNRNLARVFLDKAEKEFDKYGFYSNAPPARKDPKSERFVFIFEATYQEGDSE